MSASARTLGPSAPLLCPSAEPGMSGSVAFGIVGGTVDEPFLRHLERPLPVTEELLALAAPVRPTEVFRFAAPCACGDCPNFQEDRCGLAARIVEWLPLVADTLPACAIRPSCRWWREQGPAACSRCPQVVTDNYNPSARMRLVTDPNIRDTPEASFERPRATNLPAAPSPAVSSTSEND